MKCVLVLRAGDASYQPSNKKSVLAGGHLERVRRRVELKKLYTGVSWLQNTAAWRDIKVTFDVDESRSNRADRKCLQAFIVYMLRSMDWNRLLLHSHVGIGFVRLYKNG